MSVAVNSRVIQQALYNMAEYSANKGLSADMGRAAGTWGLRVQKGMGTVDIQTSITGVSGPGQSQPVIRCGFTDAVGANAGNSFVAAYLGAQMARGDEFLYPLASLFAHAVSSMDIIELQATAMGKSGTLDRTWADSMVNAPPRIWWHVLSALLWGDGSGIFGIGDGAYSIVGNVVTFKNSQSVHKFHPDQQVRLCDPAQVVTPGTLVTPRALADVNDIPYVAGIDDTNGTITLKTPNGVTDISAMIPGAANTDWIVPHAFFRATVDGRPEIGYYPPLVGFFAPVPYTDAEVAQPLFTVDRTLNTSARAGRRASIDASAGIEDIIAVLSEQLQYMPQDAMGETQGTMCFGSHLSGDITRAFHRQKITVVQLKDRVNDAAKWMLGTAKQGAQFPSGHVLEFMPDKMMCDPFVTRSEDRAVAVMLNNAWGLETSASGIDYKTHGSRQGGDGRVLLPVVGNQQALSAAFGAWLQLLPKNVSANLLLSPNKGATGRYVYA